MLRLVRTTCIFPPTSGIMASLAAIPTGRPTPWKPHSNFASAATTQWLKRLCEAQTTAASFEEIEEIEKQLDSGASIEDIYEAQETINTNETEEEKTMKYEISFIRNNVSQCNIYEARTEEAAQAYFTERNPEAKICGIIEQRGSVKPGMPVVIVPAGWESRYWDEISNRVFSAVTDTFRSLESAGVISDLEIEPIPAQPQEEPAAATQERSADQENREHCKRIAEDLEAYANGDMYRCPECGEVFKWDNDRYSEDVYLCPCCQAVVYECDLEAQSLYDYFSDCLDIEYRVSGRARDSYKSARIMVAFGGPTIYVDTASRAVELYWWTDRASYLLSQDVCDEIDNWAEEMWCCL